MLKEFLTRIGARRFLDRVRVGGMTVKEHMRMNRRNSEAAFVNLFRTMIRSDQPIGTVVTEAAKVSKSRKAATLRTLRNVMTGVRGRARATLATGQGRFHNRAVFDENITHTCAKFIGESWPKPYSAIPNIPPRVPPVHPCRSWIQWVPEGEPAPDERPFITQFNESEELQKDLLGPARFEAFKNGDLPITTFSQYERSVTFTLSELGLRD